MKLRYKLLLILLGSIIVSWVMLVDDSRVRYLDEIRYQGMKFENTYMNTSKDIDKIKVSIKNLEDKVRIAEDNIKLLKVMPEPKPKYRKWGKGDKRN